LVSNEIERPITVNVRPRKSRHGGVSTQIVIKENAKAAGSRSFRSTDKRSGSPPASPAGSKSGSIRPREKKASGLLKKVFGARKA
ncbi:MAG: ATPase, partial [Methanothrix sp.]|nr:ATPase [Methanothrix sp.]